MTQASGLPPVDPRQRELNRLAFRAFLADAIRRRQRAVPAVLVALLLVGVARMTADLWLGEGGADALLLAGAHMPARVLRGEWWRLFTGTMLHADEGHLLLNLVSLYVIGRPIEAAYGSARFWLLYLGAGLAGALATLAHPETLSVGASGAVFGLLGALVALGLQLWPRLTGGLRSSMVLLPALLLLGMLAVGAFLSQGNGIDHMAHVGGALGGLLLGLLLRPQLRIGEIVAVGAGKDGPRLVLTPLRKGPDGMRLFAWGGVMAMGLALALAAMRVGAPIGLPPVEPSVFVHEGMRIGFPLKSQGLVLKRGLWRSGRCEGDLTDGSWALRTGRMPCWTLPPGGLLIVGRRDQLLTQDAEDFQALRHANQQGQLVKRQPQVMLHPLGRDHLYVLMAPEPLLPGHARALAPILPPPGSAQVPERLPDRRAPAPWFALPSLVLPQALTPTVPR